MERSVSLAAQVRINAVEIDNVIACASSSNTDQNTIVAYVYPRSGATDIRYYETSGIDVDKSDYQEYRRIDIEPSDIFNGYLKKFTRFTTQEKWVIITFFENDTLHISNPIRLKHQSKPTDNVVLNITRETPPQLDPEQSYQFTLMGVSEDNWVNLLVQKEFQP